MADKKKKRSVQKAYNRLIRKLRARGSRATKYAEQSAIERGYKVPEETIWSTMMQYPTGINRAQSEAERILEEQRRKRRNK